MLLSVGVGESRQVQVLQNQKVYSSSTETKKDQKRKEQAIDKSQIESKMDQNSEMVAGQSVENFLCEDILSCISALDEVLAEYSAEYDDSLNSSPASVVVVNQKQNLKLPAPQIAPKPVKSLIPVSMSSSNSVPISSASSVGSERNHHNNKRGKKHSNSNNGGSSHGQNHQKNHQKNHHPRQRNPTPTRDHHQQQYSPNPYIDAQYQVKEDYEIRTDNIKNTGHSIAYGIVFQPKGSSPPNSNDRSKKSSSPNPNQSIPASTSSNSNQNPVDTFKINEDLLSEKVIIGGGSYPKIKNAHLLKIEESQGSKSLKIPIPSQYTPIFLTNHHSNTGGISSNSANAKEKPTKVVVDVEIDDRPEREEWNFSHAERNLPRSLRRTRKKCLLEDDQANITITTTIPIPTNAEENDHNNVPSFKVLNNSSVSNNKSSKSNNSHLRSKAFKAHLQNSEPIYCEKSDHQKYEDFVQVTQMMPVNYQQQQQQHQNHKDSQQHQNKIQASFEKRSKCVRKDQQKNGGTHLMDSVDDGYLSMVNRNESKETKPWLWPEEFIENEIFSGDELKRLSVLNQRELMEDICEEPVNSKNSKRTFLNKPDYFSDDSLEIEFDGGDQNMIPSAISIVPVVPVATPYNEQKKQKPIRKSIAMEIPWHSSEPPVVPLPLAPCGNERPKSKIPKPERKSLKLKQQQGGEINSSVDHIINNQNGDQRQAHNVQMEPPRKPCSFFIPLENLEIQQNQLESKNHLKEQNSQNHEEVEEASCSTRNFCPVVRETDIIEDLDDAPPPFIPEPPPFRIKEKEIVKEIMDNSQLREHSQTDRNHLLLTPKPSAVVSPQNEVEKESCENKEMLQVVDPAEELFCKKFENQDFDSIPRNGTFKCRTQSTVPRNQIPIVDDEFAKQMKDISEMNFRFADNDLAVDSRHFLRRHPQGLGAKLTSRSHENLLTTIELEENRPRSQQGLSSTLPINSVPPGERKRKTRGFSKMFNMILMRRKKNDQYTIQEERDDGRFDFSAKDLRAKSLYENETLEKPKKSFNLIKMFKKK